MNSLEKFHRNFSSRQPQNASAWLLFCLLLPCSLLFGLVAWMRSTLYRLGVLPSTRSKIPVLSVGNLAAGGTGKTPVIDYLIDYFSGKGFCPAVVSRGYGGSYAEAMVVVSEGSGPQVRADYCGDEPYLLALRHPQALVLVTAKRRDALTWINAGRKADLILLDDAFQHLQVARDLDIVLLDATNPYGNGYPLPLGRLREFPGALHRADLLLLTRADSREATGSFQGLPTSSCRHRLSDQFTTLDGREVSVAELKGKRGLAFAGIAGPEPFFSSLRNLGLELAAVCEFPDHEKYSGKSLARLSALGKNADYYVTTAKDAVKIAATALPKTCYIADLYIEMLDNEALNQCLESLCDRIKNADKF